MSSSTIDGIDVANVTAWFEANVPGSRAPFSFQLIAGGHSNLTYGVTDASGARYVLRRPPLGQLLASAHDVAREFRIISSLQPTNVPVPPALGLCTDPAVNDQPFYVMGFVDGHVVRNGDEALSLLSEAGRLRAGHSVADVLADIHAVDPDAVGLGDLGRREGYIARQLKRWYSQFQQSNELTGRPVPLIHEVHDALAAMIPEQGPAAIVHGDYRLDNSMVDGDGNVIAVLDWEICTLGDPMADVGLLMVYWNEPGDTHSTLLNAPTSAPGFPSRAEMLDRYAERSGRDVSGVDFYMAFAYWKLACIIEGVFSRYAAGAMGSDASGFDAFDRQVTMLAAQAHEQVEKLA